VPKYEVVVVFDPNQTEELQKEELAKVEEVITKNGGTIDSQEIWGKRRLAFPINRRREGYYALVTFDTVTSNAVLAELNRHLRIAEPILRSLVTRAVVGKAKGTPPPPEEMARYQSPRPFGGRRREGGDRPRGEYRGGDRGGDRGGEHRSAAPAYAPPPVAAPAPEPQT